MLIVFYPNFIFICLTVALTIYFPAFFAKFSALLCIFSWLFFKLIHFIWRLLPLRRPERITPTSICVYEGMSGKKSPPAAVAGEPTALLQGMSTYATHSHISRHGHISQLPKFFSSVTAKYSIRSTSLQ